MRAVIQRVRQASVYVNAEPIGRIGQGVLILLGVAKGDEASDVQYIVDKVVGLRLFSDEQGKMNLPLPDIGGAALVVSQFTLLGDTSSGRRPGFDAAAPPEEANGRYEEVVQGLKAAGVPVETGRFGAAMLVTLQNDGPVTFILDSRARK